MSCKIRSFVLASLEVAPYRQWQGATQNPGQGNHPFSFTIYRSPSCEKSTGRKIFLGGAPWVSRKWLRSVRFAHFILEGVRPLYLRTSHASQPVLWLPSSGQDAPPKPFLRLFLDSRFRLGMANGVPSRPRHLNVPYWLVGGHFMGLATKGSQLLFAEVGRGLPLLITDRRLCPF